MFQPAAPSSGSGSASGTSSGSAAATGGAGSNGASHLGGDALGFMVVGVAAIFGAALVV